MALTAAEKQKRYRERQKLKAAGLLNEAPPPPPLDLPNSGLLAFIKSHGEDALPLEVGRVWDDLHHISTTLLKEGEPQTEIGRMEKAIEYLSMSLEVLTGFLSDFRKEQIGQEIERAKREQLGDPGVQEQALQRIIRLNEVRKGLDKKYRLELSSYFVPDD